MLHLMVLPIARIAWSVMLCYGQMCHGMLWYTKEIHGMDNVTNRYVGWLLFVVCWEDI